jgi:hypothetical protein
VSVACVRVYEYAFYRGMSMLFIGCSLCARV